MASKDTGEEVEAIMSLIFVARIRSRTRLSLQGLLLLLPLRWGVTQGFMTTLKL